MHKKLSSSRIQNSGMNEHKIATMIDAMMSEGTNETDGESRRKRRSVLEKAVGDVGGKLHGRKRRSLGSCSWNDVTASSIGDSGLVRFKGFIQKKRIYMIAMALNYLWKHRLCKKKTFFILVIA